MQRQQQQQQPQHPQQCDYNGPLVLKLREADDFGAAVQGAIRAGEVSSQVHDFLLLGVTPFVNAFGDDWWYHDEAYRTTAR